MSMTQIILGEMDSGIKSQYELPMGSRHDAIFKPTGKCWVLAWLNSSEFSCYYHNEDIMASDKAYYINNSSNTERTISDYFTVASDGTLTLNGGIGTSYTMIIVY